MSQHVFPTRRVVRIIAAIGTILALMLAGGAPHDITNDAISNLMLNR